MKKKKKLSVEIIKDALEKFCMDFYGFIPAWKRLKFKHCNGYYLTEYGHLLRPSYDASRIIVIKGMEMKGRKSKTGKQWKAGFVVDQFYKMVDGKSKRFWTIPRSKLMYMVFKNWTETKVRHFSFFPKDGNNRNLHVDNLIPYDKFMEGAIKTYGRPQGGKLSNREIIAIRRSGKTNRELGQRYNRNLHTISRIRNNRAYKDVIKLV